MVGIAAVSTYVAPSTPDSELLTGKDIYPFIFIHSSLICVPSSRQPEQRLSSMMVR